MQTLSRFFVSVLVLFTVVANTAAQNHTTMSLPEGAKARIGKGTIHKMKYSPDGTRLAVLSSVGVWIYDAQTGEELELLAVHTAGIGSVAFSPDGKTLATGSWDGIVRLWNVNRRSEAFGRKLRTLTPGVTKHPIFHIGVAFSPDGRTLAAGAGGWGEHVHLWDVDTGSHLHTFPRFNFNDLAFSPDGRTLAINSLLFDVNRRSETFGRPRYSLSGGEVVAFSPDGRTLAIGGVTVYFGVKVGKYNLDRDSFEYPNQTDYSDRRSLARENWGEAGIDLWNVNAEEPLRTLTYGHTLSFPGIHDVAFSPDGKTLATRALAYYSDTLPYRNSYPSSDHCLRLWDVNTSRELRTLTGWNPSAGNFGFSPDGKTLASAHDNGIRLWDVNTGNILHTHHGEGRSSSIVFSPDGRTLATNDGYLWNINVGSRTRIDGAISVAFSPDGKTLATGSRDGTVCLWSANLGTELLAFASREAESVAFSPDGKTLAVTGSQSAVRLWNVNTGGLLHTLVNRVRRNNGVWNSWSSGHRNVAFSPDGKTLAAAPTKAPHTTVHLWDANTGSPLRTFTGHMSDYKSVTFSSDGTTLASAGADGTVVLWELNPSTTLGIKEPIRPKEDVNGDGVVNIQDLVGGASHLGQSGNTAADVNGDGVVNIQDLVLVAGALD